MRFERTGAAPNLFGALVKSVSETLENRNDKDLNAPRANAMSAMEWITLGGLAFTVAAAVIGSAIRLTWWLSEKFAEMKDTYAAGLDEHEAKDQARHEDNLARFARVEAKLATIIRNGNGGRAHPRAGRVKR